MSLRDVRPYKGKRRKLLDHLLNPENSEKTVAETCRDVNLAVNTYYKYTKEKEFNEALIEESIRAYARHLPQTVTSVIKSAKKGNLKAAKLLHEALQLIGAGNSQTVNIANQPDRHTVIADTPEQLLDEISRQIDDLTRLKIQLTGAGTKRLDTPCHTPTQSDDEGSGV